MFIMCNQYIKNKLTDLREPAHLERVTGRKIIRDRIRKGIGDSLEVNHEEFQINRDDNNKLTNLRY